MKLRILVFVIALHVLSGLSSPSLFTFAGNTINPVDEKKISRLEAVLVVGPQEDGTKAAIEKMDKIADFLLKKGLKVHRFYDENTDWSEIKSAARNAHFFVYSGHGSRHGENGNVGGLILSSSVSSKTIVEEMQLKKNAVVIFKSVCNGAGSSAGDDGDIGITEAVKRVSDYSNPFFKIGAGCYFANNLGDGCLDFLANFFSGVEMKSCFEESAKTWTEIEYEKVYHYDKRMQISIASTDWGGTVTRTTYTNGVKSVEEIPSSKDYSIAYVARPDFSIIDLLREIR